MFLNVMLERDTLVSFVYKTLHQSSSASASHRVEGSMVLPFQAPGSPTRALKPRQRLGGQWETKLRARRQAAHTRRGHSVRWCGNARAARRGYAPPRDRRRSPSRDRGHQLPSSALYILKLCHVSKHSRIELEFCNSSRQGGLLLLKIVSKSRLGSKTARIFFHYSGTTAPDCSYHIPEFYISHDRSHTNFSIRSPSQSWLRISVCT